MFVRSFLRKPSLFCIPPLLTIALGDSVVFGSPVVPLSAVSRKTNAAAEVFDVALPLTGAAGIECRSGGISGDHQIIITFAAPVTFAGASVTTGTGSVSSSSASGSEVAVSLTDVGNAQRITVTLVGVNDGTTANNVIVPMSLLAGDTTGDGSTNSGDISQTKSQSGAGGECF